MLLLLTPITIVLIAIVADSSADAFSEILGTNSVQQAQSQSQTSSESIDEQQQQQANNDRMNTIYKKWCQEFDKKQDATRFQTFSSNYLYMEAYSKESGTPMDINEWYDFNEQEYAALTKNNSDGHQDATADW